MKQRFKAVSVEIAVEGIQFILIIKNDMPRTLNAPASYVLMFTVSEIS